MKACAKPCSECPFMGTMPNWIGSYESWDHLHQTVMYHERFPCHLTQIDKMDKPTPEKEVVCKGSLIYMKKCAKMPNDPEIKKLMDELTEEEIAMGKNYVELKEIHSWKK